MMEDKKIGTPPWERTPQFNFGPAPVPPMFNQDPHLMIIQYISQSMSWLHQWLDSRLTQIEQKTVSQ